MVSLVHAKMSYEIAEDMFRNALKINRCHTESLCMPLFLCCVELFSSIRETLLSYEDKKTLVEKPILDVHTAKITNCVLTETQNWLRINYSFWTQHLKVCLNVSSGPKVKFFSSTEPKAQGELIVWDSSRSPSMGASVHTFKYL